MATKKKTAKSAEDASAPGAKKVPAKKASTKKVAKKAAKAGAPKAAPAPDAIARAAYLNYRRRVELGLPGDSHGDWIEAERSLSQGA